LDLSTNSLSAKSGKLVADALKGNTTVEELYLHDNSLGDESGEVFATALKENTTLKEFALSGNSLGDVGSEVGINIMIEEFWKNLYERISRQFHRGTACISDC
jgi:hypothetical protein